MSTGYHQDVSAVGRISYRLRRIQGEGGLGQVWLAQDDELRRDVAIKVIRPEGRHFPENNERFLREVRITGLLQHPNIIPIYHAGKDENSGDVFYAMPFVAGRSLAQVISECYADGKQPTPTEFLHLVNIFVDVCDAVGYAHSRRILHRDLKPDNIMVGEFGEVMVLDWGLAKLLDEDDDASSWISTASNVVVSRETSVIGSPSYMAPEQAGQTDLIDERSDVFGLGAILYTILTGEQPRVPRQMEMARQLYERVRNHPIPKVSEVNPKAPPALAAISAKATAHDIDERYEDCNLLIQDISRWMAGEPVEVYKEPWRLRLKRWLLRHRLLTSSIAGAAVLFALAAGVLMTYSWSVSKMVEHEIVAQVQRQAALQANTIQDRVLRREADASYLAQLPTIQKLIAARKANNDADEKKLTQSLASLFTTFLRANTAYGQIVLATPDSQGEYIVNASQNESDSWRVESSTNGTIDNINIRSAIRDASFFDPEEFRFFEVGIVDDGKRAVSLMLGVAVRDNETGEPFGALLLRTDYRYLFRFQSDTPNTDEVICLSNRWGQYLIQARSITGEIDHPMAPLSIQNEYPKIAGFFSSNQKSPQELFVDEGDNPRVFVCRRIPFPLGDTQENLVLVVTRSLRDAWNRSVWSNNWVVLVTIVMIITSLAVILVLMRALLRDRLMPTS
ncbi:Serine/threonine-protein kinase PknD [Planctomycetes bacterium Pan216]|uniref:Serine/threonine-protein kinase PknD n=1 Tax=Kolteria novifilia TaxID=2527975 RepID=A0A518B668_9BACT|nr:Serine/threonine-protein kinase PknD [Planctomycetes bacterium Pan216]